MANPKQISAHFGQRAIGLKLGVTDAAVSAAVVRGKFPPAWYPVLRDMCAAEGIECPESAFGFKSVNHQHLTDGGAGSLETST